MRNRGPVVMAPYFPAMNRLLVVALVSVLCGVGCTKVADMVSEDARRLGGIERMFDNGEYEQALPEATKYVQEYPRAFQGWALLGWIQVKVDNLDEAVECFDKALAFNPKWDNAHVGKGAAYRKKGDTDNARKSYLEAIRIVPDNPEAFSSLLVIELLDGNDEEAIEYGEKAWALRKDLPSIPSNLAVAYHYMGDYSKRDQYYEEAERLGYHKLRTLQDIFDGNISIR